jgi:hypothetical protein
MMARTIGQTKPVEALDAIWHVRVTWAAWRAFQDAQASVEFRRSTSDAAAQSFELAKEEDAANLAFLKAVIVNWDGVNDADGNPVAYSPEQLESEFSPVECVILQNEIMSQHASSAPAEVLPGFTSEKSGCPDATATPEATA